MKQSKWFTVLLALVFLSLATPGSTEASATLLLVKDEFEVGQGDHGVVAINGVGAFGVAWYDDRSRSMDSFVRHFDSSGQPLTGEIYVHQTRKGAQTNPRLDTDGADRAVFVWSAQNSSGKWNTTARLVYGTKWLTGEFLVNPATDPSDLKSHPYACMYGAGPYQGYFAVAWSDKLSATKAIHYLRLYDPQGSPLGIPIQIDASQATGALENYIASLSTAEKRKFSFVALDCRSDGDLVVVWERLGEQVVLVGRRFNAFYDLALWEPEFVISQPAPDVIAQRRPIVSLNETGSFVVSWLEHPATYSRSDVAAFAQLRGPTDINQMQLGSGTGNFMPTVEMRASGGFVAAWSTLTSDGEADVWMQDFSAEGIAQSLPILVSYVRGDPSTPRPGYQIRPAIAWYEVAGVANMVITWESNHSGTNRVYARMFRW